MSEKPTTNAAEIDLPLTTPAEETIASLQAKRAQAEKERDAMREELKPLRALPAKLAQAANEHAQNEAKMQKSIDDAYAEVAKLKAEKTKLEKLNLDLANQIEEARQLATNATIDNLDTVTGKG